MKLDFDAVFYYVSDLDRAIHFYIDVLGFKLHSRDYVARFNIDEVLFELVPAPDSTKMGGEGNARLCLESDDISAAIAELRAKGVQIGDAVPKQNGLLTSFRDPDGNEICIWQYRR
jgi:catechol 2,3-dioxygenase-like lactoylglutathione lyase family enzyme